MRAFIVRDLLSLLAVAAARPGCFVGVGPAALATTCRRCVVEDRPYTSIIRRQVYAGVGPALPPTRATDLLTAALKEVNEPSRYFLLMPDVDTACAIRYDVADPMCYCCTRPIRSIND